MRKITVDFSLQTYPLFAGYVGEHNATELTAIKPNDLEGVTYSLAFMTNGEVIHSEFFGADEEIKVTLWQQLTQDNTLYVQLEAYDENGEYLGKSTMVKLVLSNSVHGTDVIADSDNPDVYSEIALNTWFRETLEDNTDTLDKLTTSEDGTLLFNGKKIEGVGGSSSLDVEVKTDTEDEYVLEIITDAETITTPNLKGTDGKSGVYVGSGEMPEGYNVQIDPEGDTDYLQITPLFANSIEECTDTSKVYVLPDGYIYAYINDEWSNTGHAFTTFDTLEKVIGACCDAEIVQGGNPNLLKISEVEFSTRLQDNVEGTTTSTATNAVTGWIPVEYGKYYCMSVLYDGVRTTQPGGAGSMYIRMNARKADGTIVVYNKGNIPLASSVASSKQVINIEYEDVVAIRLHFNVFAQDISTPEKLGQYQPMFVSGITPEKAYENAINLEYIDGDVFVPAEVEYTLKHDYTKADKVSISPYYRDVNFGIIPSAYYKGVSASYNNSSFTKETTYGDFIEAWKALIDDHSGYVTETELGTASDGQKIYLYDFKPVRIENQKRNIPKIIVVAGQHGFEKSNIYGLYHFVDNLLNRWNQHPSLEYLRNHVELMIVPVVNTYGFDNLTYKNANGVNINRNYDSNWVSLDDATSPRYGGAEPFDQPESQIVRDLLNNNNDALLLVDFHTNGSSSVAQYNHINYYGICESDDKYYNRMIDAVAYQISAISANFNLDYNLNQPDTLLGFLNHSRGNGLLRDWATDNNFVGVLVEAFNGFPNSEPFTKDVYKANEEIIVNYLITAMNYLGRNEV